MKIVILDGATITQKDLWWDDLSQMGELEVHDRTVEPEAAAAIGNAEAAFTSKCEITAETMDACPKLKFIGSLATGYDNIDIKAAKDRGIAVCNVPAYSTNSWYFGATTLALPTPWFINCLAAFVPFPKPKTSMLRSEYDELHVVTL